MSKLTYTSKLGLFFVIPFILLLLGSCTKDNRDEVPYVFLNLNLGLNTDLANLGVGEEAIITLVNGIWTLQFSSPRLPNVILGSGQVINGNGLIIYRKDLYTYEVYDITCTFRAQTDYCSLERNPDFAQVFDCPCCESVFIYVSDSYYVQQGPAAMPLRRYNTFIQANNLIIRN